MSDKELAVQLTCAFLQARSAIVANSPAGDINDSTMISMLKDCYKAVRELGAEDHSAD